MPMPKDGKKKKLTIGDGFTVGSAESFCISLGELTGAPKKEKAPEKKEEKPNRSAGQDSSLSLANVQKITLHRQSSGRGGRVVTVVTLSGGEGIDLETLAKEMRKGLGCGSRVENGKVVLQGEIQDRAAEWFGKRGVKRVVMGN